MGVFDDKTVLSKERLLAARARLSTSVLKVLTYKGEVESLKQGDVFEVSDEVLERLNREFGRVRSFLDVDPVVSKTKRGYFVDKELLGRDLSVVVEDLSSEDFFLLTTNPDLV
jgi:hypothetical protein